MFCTFSHRLSFQLCIEIFYFLTKYVQSRLLQDCGMRERVKIYLSMFETYCPKLERYLSDVNHARDVSRKLRKIMLLLCLEICLYESDFL